MPALRPVASVLILIAAVVLLANAGVAIIDAIDTVFFGGGDEREEFATGVIQASGLPAAVAFLIAGTMIWQRTARVFRPLLIGIGLLLLPIITALLIPVEGTGGPPLRVLAQVLVLALLGLAAAYGLVPLERRRMVTPVPPPVPVDPRGRGRRIAALIIALLATVPSAPMIVFLAAISFDPLEAWQEPNIGAGITVIAIGIGMIAMVILAALALVRPRWWSMLSFVILAAILAGANILLWVLAVVLGLDQSGQVEALLLPMAASVFLLVLGWLSRGPER